ncbi:MAG TPA: hypothetical protein PK876_09585 [Elusimicrobiota bacterium]|nr:hypothetical protein [Elusimicrobiota bacterium]
MRDLKAVLKEVEERVQENRGRQVDSESTVKDFRRSFDEESALMNRAIFNEETDRIRETCLKTVAALVEILSRT